MRHNEQHLFPLCLNIEMPKFQSLKKNPFFLTLGQSFRLGQEILFLAVQCMQNTLREEDALMLIHPDFCSWKFHEKNYSPNVNNFSHFFE